jgi:hypothetical protein
MFERKYLGFAALPTLNSTPSTEQLLASVQLPPPPAEVTDDFDMEALERHFQHIKQPSSRTSIDSYSNGGESPISRTEPMSSLSSLEPDTPVAEHHKLSSMSSDLHRLHANLESRLQPFWSTALASRTIRISVFASFHHREEKDDEHQKSPITTQSVVTGPDGSFQTRFKVSWEDMCMHPQGLQIAFGPLQEHDLVLSAELLPPTPSPSTAHVLPTPAVQVPSATADLRICITHSPIRVISDIDDTIKRSNILSSARAVFYNVFVKELQDSVIPGMGEWYTNMYNRGVRFHYVSNGPFELLPVVNEFLQISQLPPGMSSSILCS